MTANHSNANKMSAMDKIKWTLIFLVVAGAVVANSMYPQYSVAMRTVAFIVLALVLIGVALTTDLGRFLWKFMKESRQELRKVVWPTRQETTQTTMIIIVIVCILSLVLWGVDSAFAMFVRSIIF